MMLDQVLVENPRAHLDLDRALGEERARERAAGWVAVLGWYGVRRRPVDMPASTSRSKFSISISARRCDQPSLVRPQRS